MYKDITIKARLAKADQTEKIIQSLNALFIGKDLQTDHYFKTEKGKLKWREGIIENLITHYERIVDHGAERTIVYRYDLNPTKEMLNDLTKNYLSIGFIRKERKIYKLSNIKIHLDKLSSGEEFIEIEAIDSEGKFSIEELKEQCQSLKEKLKINDHDLVPTGYLKTS